MKVLLEACVESARGAVVAEEAGADRVELCANLLEGGTTPSYGTIRAAREHVGIPIHVMIRPRGGDFCYSDDEFEVMNKDIEMAKTLGVDGVVFGLLNEDGTVDRNRTRELMVAAQPMTATFHRAFDMTCDPFAALSTLIDLSISRILTSGQRASALEGLALIRNLIREADGRIVIMPGGGIGPETIRPIVSESGASEVHVAALVPTESRMRFRNPNCYMGINEGPPEFSTLETNGDLLRRSVQELASLACSR